MRVEIYHNLKAFKIKERVFETKRFETGLHMMDIYTRFWEQDKTQYHEIKINGRYKPWAEVFAANEEAIVRHRLRDKKAFETWAC